MLIDHARIICDKTVIIHSILTNGGKYFFSCFPDFPAPVDGTEHHILFAWVFCCFCCVLYETMFFYCWVYLLFFKRLVKYLFLNLSVICMSAFVSHQILFFIFIHKYNISKIYHNIISACSRKLEPIGCIKRERFILRNWLM